MLTSSRRRSERDQRRQRRRAAADRRIGHDMAYWYEAVDLAKVVVPPLALALIGWWVWTHVDHGRLAGYVGGAGALLLALYLGWVVRSSTARARIMSIARGTTHRNRYWHLIGLAGALLVVAAIVMVRQ